MLQTRHIVLILILLCSVIRTDAQQVIIDTTLGSTPSPVFGDSVTEKKNKTITSSLATEDTAKKPFEPNAKKAGMYSAIIPGLGQAYDRNYWKIPVIYLGLGVAGYFIKDNSEKYRKYRKAYISRRDADPNNDQLTDLYSNANDLKTLQDEYKKYLDLTILITGIGYTLQIVDAVVFAHLKNFDISRNISMQVGPSITPSYAGLGLRVNFK